MSTNKDLKTRLFGKTTKKPKMKKNFQINKQELNKPFEIETAVIYYFCTACGTLSQVTQKYLDIMIKSFNLEINPEKDITNFYLEGDACESCSADKRKKVLLKKK